MRGRAVVHFADAMALARVEQDAFGGGGLAGVDVGDDTLARNAGLLVNVAGYRCVAAGAVNMFPHTAHVESMAVFERG